MDFRTLTMPEAIPGDEHRFADDAFRRAHGVCQNGGIDSVDELRLFLEAEANECERRAMYLRQMTKYFHENAAFAQEMEAKAMRVMLRRLQ